MLAEGAPFFARPCSDGRIQAIFALDELEDVLGENYCRVAEYFQGLLRDSRLAWLSHPFHRQIFLNMRVTFQRFFEEAQADFLCGKPTKPLFFSPQVRQVVFSPIDLTKVLRALQDANSDPKQQVSASMVYCKRLIEFQLHEYGHIADKNGLISFCSDELRTESESRREQLLKKFSLTNEVLTDILEAESDLRADKWRLSLPHFENRSKSSFITWAFKERLQEKSPIRRDPSNFSNVVYFSVWSPVILREPKEWAERYQREIAKRIGACNEKMLPFYQELSEYFEQYYNGLTIKNEIPA